MPTKEVHLYGVTHAVSIKNQFVRNHHLEVDPPAELIGEIIGHSDAPLVSLELSPSMVIDDSELPYKVSLDNIGIKGLHFFASLETNLQDGGIETRRIDDDELNRQSVVASEVISRISDLGRRLYDNNQLLDDGAQRHRQLLHIRVLRMQRTLRETKLFENISESSPDVVIVGQEHADRLFNDIKLQDSLGVAVKSFSSIVPEEVTKAHLFDDIPLMGSHIVDLSELQPSDAVVETQRQKREELERIYRSFVHGRVLPEGSPQPDFIGTFNCSIAEMGLFELHIDSTLGQEFVGRIYDYVGDASVCGHMDENGDILSFSKIYDQAVSAEMAAKGKIEYEVKKAHDGRYGLIYNGQSTGGGAYMMRSGTGPVESIIQDCRGVLDW